MGVCLIAKVKKIMMDGEGHSSCSDRETLLGEEWEGASKILTAKLNKTIITPSDRDPLGTPDPWREDPHQTSKFEGEGQI